MDLRYWNRYLKFIEMCDGQTYNDVYYYERHHIIPKSLGGDNSEDNLIRLTARQHFIAHVLLIKATNSPQMYYAVHLMACAPQQSNYLNSKEVELARELYSQREVTPETRKKQSEAKLGKSNPKTSARNKLKTGRIAFRSDNRLLWFYNEELNLSIFITRLQAKQEGLPGISGVSAKRLYLGHKPIRGWQCLSCMLKPFEP